MVVQKTKSGVPTKLKLQIAALVILAIVALATWYGASYYQSEVESNSKVDAQYSALFSQIKATESQSNQISEEIKASGTSLSGTFMSKDEFVTFLGANVQRLGLKLSQYTGGETVSANGIETINFKVETIGQLAQLTELVAAIDSLKTPYAINAMSVRKADGYVWLDRDVDKTESLKWWDGKSLEQKKAYTEVEDVPPIGVADMISGADLYFYIDISFTTSTATQDGVTG